MCDDDRAWYRFSILNGMRFAEPEITLLPTYSIFLWFLNWSHQLSLQSPSFNMIVTLLEGFTKEQCKVMQTPTSTALKAIFECLQNIFTSSNIRYYSLSNEYYQHALLPVSYSKYCISITLKDSKML